MSLFMRVRSFLYRMGIRAVPLVAERPLGLFMYYGGGTFLNVKDSFQGVSVEAYYADLEKEPAILWLHAAREKPYYPEFTMNMIPNIPVFSILILNRLLVCLKK